MINNDKVKKLARVILKPDKNEIEVLCPWDGVSAEDVTNGAVILRPGDTFIPFYIHLFAFASHGDCSMFVQGCEFATAGDSIFWSVPTPISGIWFAACADMEGDGGEVRFTEYINP